MGGTQVLHVPGAIVVNHRGPTHTGLELGLPFLRGEEVGEGDLSGQEPLLYHAREVYVDGAADVARVVGEDRATVDDEVLLVCVEISG